MTIPKDKIRISITFPKPLAEKLREQAAQEGKGISEIVVEKISAGRTGEGGIKMFDKTTASKSLKNAAKDRGIGGNWKWEPCNSNSNVSALCDKTAAIIHSKGQEHKIPASELSRV